MDLRNLKPLLKTINKIQPVENIAISLAVSPTTSTNVTNGLHATV